MKFDPHTFPWKIVVSLLVGVAVGITTGDWSLIGSGV